MSADATRERANRNLAPDDAVGNALCDALLDSPDPSVIRVLNWHGDWAQAAPNWADFRATVDAVDDVAAKWPAGGQDGYAIVVRSTPRVGTYERVEVDGETTVSQVSEAGGKVFEDLTATAGPPRLVPLDDVLRHFEDGDVR